MGTAIGRVFLTAVFVLGVGALQLLPRASGDAYHALLKRYAPVTTQAIHREGCLDPAGREPDPDIDVIRVSVEHETTLLVTVEGKSGLEPAFVVTADEGPAATTGWMRELASRSGVSISTPVILPAHGLYSFVIADRRQLLGDEMAAGHGCFVANLKPTAPPRLQNLGVAWRGTVGLPVAFTVGRHGTGDLSLVEVTNLSDDGILMVSTFEDNTFAASLTAAPKEKVHVVVSSAFQDARVIVEEATSWGPEPMRAMVRAVPFSIAPDGSEEIEGERVAFGPDDGSM